MKNRFERDSSKSSFFIVRSSFFISLPLHFPLPLFALNAILPKKCKGGAMPRKWLLCFDGTWNHPDDEQRPEDQQVETNVRRLFEAALDGPRLQDQVQLYDDGIGNQG